MVTKTCKRCREVLPLSEFKMRFDMSVPKLRGTCTACLSEQKAPYWAKRKEGKPKPLDAMRAFPLPDRRDVALVWRIAA
jgi:hypothetical protein